MSILNIKKNRKQKVVELNYQTSRYPQWINDIR